MGTAKEEWQVLFSYQSASLLNNIKKQLDDRGKETLSAYLSLVENFAPFMQSGVADSMQRGKAVSEPDKSSLEYQLQIQRID